MLRTGELRQRVTIQNRTETSDGHDGVTESWTDVLPARRSAKVAPLAGKDLERARQIDPRISHEVVLRFWGSYVTDLDGGRARLVFHDGDTGDRTFEIVTPPTETEYRIALSMMCREAA